MMRAGLVLAMACLLAGPASAGADAILHWNNVWLEAVRAEGGMPAPLARTGAIVHVAMYDALNAIVRSHEPCIIMLPETEAQGASKKAALAAAAHRSLVHVFPGQQALFDTALTDALAALPDGLAKTKGIALGHAAADAVIATRGNDGSTTMMPYTPPLLPGHWRPTGPDYTNPFNPDWPGVTPWAMTSGDMFRPAPPPPLNSPEYAAAWQDVYEKGSLIGSTRTQEETDVASFWANDRDGTYKPMGHLNHVTQVVARQQGLSEYENARLFALVNIALADAGVVAWDAKYSGDMDLWRPVTGIHEADSDGNAATVSDPDWVPMSHDAVYNGFTPPFPAYTSGHATFAAAHAAVMIDLFGDDVTFSITTDDTGYFGPAWRTYDSFTQIALENGRSRVYLGVHWQFDADAGYASGAALGHYVTGSMLRAIPEPATLFVLAAALVAGCIRRRRTGEVKRGQAFA